MMGRSRSSATTRTDIRCSAETSGNSKPLACAIARKVGISDCLSDLTVIALLAAALGIDKRSANIPMPSEVIDLKPTNRRPHDSVKSRDAEYSRNSRTAQWPCHIGSGMSGPSVPKWVHRKTGNPRRAGDVHAGATGEAHPIAGGAGAGHREVPRGGATTSRAGADSDLPVRPQGTER